MNTHDTSNMGRCCICGAPIDLRDEGHDLVAIEQDGDLDDTPVTQDDANAAIADALVRLGGPENHALADAIEGQGEPIMHAECEQQTSWDQLPTTADV